MSRSIEVQQHGTESARGWPLVFVRGLVALFLGGALLIAGAGQSRLATFIGVYWLLGAVLTIRWVFRAPGLPGRRLGALAGVIGGLAAAALLAREPLDSVVGMNVLLHLVGAGAIATGVTRMLGGFRDDEPSHGRPRKRNSILVGALDVGLGVAVITASNSTSTWIRFMAAAWGLIGGTVLLAEALRLRQLSAATATES